MSRKTKEPQFETVRKYKAYRNAHYALKVVPYPTAIAPFAIQLGLNWNVWFPGDKDGTTVGIGLAMALLTTLLSVLAIAKKDSEFMKKVGPFVSVGFAFLAWGAVCLFLASVLTELGKMLIYSGCGILAAAVEDAVDKAVVKEKYLFMKDLADSKGLSKKGEWQQTAIAQAEADAEAKKGVTPVE